MEGIDYSEFVMTLAKPGQDILNEMAPDQMHLLHMAVGVSGEAGELLDAIKKMAVYQKQLDRENVLEEVGDILFYLEGICSLLGFTREDAIKANIKKLEKRYKDGYSNKAAQERADKNEDKPIDVIIYDGTGQPEDDHILVEVICQNGLHEEGRADEFDWNITANGFDIVAYRVIES